MRAGFVSQAPRILTSAALRSNTRLFVLLAHTLLFAVVYPQLTVLRISSFIHGWVHEGEQAGGGDVSVLVTLERLRLFDREANALDHAKRKKGDDVRPRMLLSGRVPFFVDVWNVKLPRHRADDRLFRHNGTQQPPSSIKQKQESSAYPLVDSISRVHRPQFCTKHA